MHLVADIRQWIRDCRSIDWHALTRRVFLCAIRAFLKRRASETYHTLTRDNASDGFDIGIVDHDLLSAAGETWREVSFTIIAAHRLVDVRRAVALGVARISQIDD